MRGEFLPLKTTAGGDAQDPVGIFFPPGGVQRLWPGSGGWETGTAWAGPVLRAPPLVGRPDLPASGENDALLSSPFSLTRLFSFRPTNRQLHHAAFPGPPHPNNARDPPEHNDALDGRGRFI